MPVKVCWISCGFFQFVLGNTVKMSCDKVLKAMKLGNEILLQYYHEQVISAVGRAKKLSDAELIIKLASSSVGEPIFRDLRSEICIPSEKKRDVFILPVKHFTGKIFLPVKLKFYW